MTVRETYAGSDGEATKLLYIKLAALGPVGEIAMNLFRAQKCSARAKEYRRRAHKSEAYDRKNWSIGNLCNALLQHAETLGLVWGWKQDPQAEHHVWVLYVDTPAGQVSFHAYAPGDGPYYPGEWDRSHSSGERILFWCEVLMGERSAVPMPRPAEPVARVQTKLL